jgi:hypothetical protein
MVAGRPVTLHDTPMAIQADAIVLIKRIERFFLECSNTLAVFKRHMIRTRAVTGLTGVLALHVMREHGAVLHRGMASHTCITPDHLCSKQWACQKRKSNSSKN